MRILHVAESIRGGCGTYLNEVIPLQAQSADIEAVHCLVPRQHASQLVDVPQPLISTFDRPSRVGGLRRLAAGILSALRSSRPDVIHAHSTFAGALVRVLSVPVPMPPVVYCPHGWVFDVEQPRATRAVVRATERLLSYRSERIIAISEAERQQGLDAGISEQRLALVYNGIRAACTRRRAQWDDPRLKLLFVGRLDRQKGLDVLLQAVQDLHDTVNVRVLGARVVGGESADASADAPHVEYRGWCEHEEVAAHINACDAVVMPSRWEGFGLVAVEAMRAGKAVIASAVGGLAEVVDDGVSGLLVAPGDAAALSSAIARCTPELLHTMGDAGRRRFLAHYTIDRTHRGLMEVYHQVLTAAHLVPATPGEDLRS